MRLIEGRAERVDWQARRVECVSAVGEERFVLPFDLLAIAVGAAVADYGVPGVREHALTLASVEDARAVRRGILDQFARAEVPGLSDEEVARRLTFVVCGGGATGVEVAAEVHDLLAGELAASYPELAPRGRVVLVEAAERILGGFDAALGGYAHRHFQREGIEVRLGTAVSAVERDGVRLRDGGFLPAGLVLWAGGNTPVPFVATLGEPLTPRGTAPCRRPPAAAGPVSGSTPWAIARWWGILGFPPRRRWRSSRGSTWRRRWTAAAAAGRSARSASARPACSPTSAAARRSPTCRT